MNITRKKKVGRIRFTTKLLCYLAAIGIAYAGSQIHFKRAEPDLDDTQLELTIKKEPPKPVVSIPGAYMDMQNNVLYLRRGFDRIKALNDFDPAKSSQYFPEQNKQFHAYRAELLADSTRTDIVENPEEQLRLLKRASHHIRLQLGEKNWHFGLAVKRWERTTKIKKDLPESEQKPLDGKIRECYNFTKILFPCTDIPEISQNSPTFTWDCDDILDRYRKNALGISYFHNDESDIDLDGIEQRVKTLENPSEIQQENLKLLVSMLHDVSPKVNDKDVPRLYDISLKALDLAPDEALKLQALLGLTESYFSLEDEKEGGRSANTLAAYSKTLDWSPALSLAMGSVLKERVRKWPMSSQIDGYNTVIELYKNVPDSELNGEKITLYLDRGILHLLEYMRSNDIESGQKSAKDIGRAMTLFHTDLPHPDLGAGLYAKEISKLADSVVAKRFPEINIDTRMDIVDQVENMVLSFYIHTKR